MISRRAAMAAVVGVAALAGLLSVGERGVVAAQPVTPSGGMTGQGLDLIRATRVPNGVVLAFSEPLATHMGWDVEDYRLVSGLRGQALDVEIVSASVSFDGRSVFLETDRALPALGVSVEVAPELLCRSTTLIGSRAAEVSGSSEAPGVKRDRPAWLPMRNALSVAEEAAGWKLLFDGEKISHFRGFGRDEVPGAWRVEDGALAFVPGSGGGGDIVTRDQFKDFELELEWKISPGGNSGIFFGVVDNGEHSAVWQTGPEMQVLDNGRHADGRDPATSAGSNYALHAPHRDTTYPVGAYNRVRLVKRGASVEHWLNGELVIRYDLNSPEWRELVSRSKFSGMPAYGKAVGGAIALQDHGDRVWYRNIKIRRLL